MMLLLQQELAVRHIHTLSPLLANPLWLLFWYVPYWFLSLLITFNALRVLPWCMAFHLQQQLWLRLFLIVVPFNPQEVCLNLKRQMFQRFHHIFFSHPNHRNHYLIYSEAWLAHYSSSYKSHSLQYYWWSQIRRISWSWQHHSVHLNPCIHKMILNR